MVAGSGVVVKSTVVAVDSDGAGEPLVDRGIVVVGVGVSALGVDVLSTGVVIVVVVISTQAMIPTVTYAKKTEQ